MGDGAAQAVTCKGAVMSQQNFQTAGVVMDRLEIAGVGGINIRGRYTAFEDLIYEGFRV